MPDPTISDENAGQWEADSQVDVSVPDASGSKAAQPEAGVSGVSESDLDEFDRAEVSQFRAGLEADESAEVIERLQAQRHQLSVRPPGPGISEAVGWMVGVIVVHLFGMIIALFSVMTLQVMDMTANGVTPSPGELQATIMTLPETFGLELMTIEMLVFLVAAVVAVRLRLGPKTARLMGFRPLETSHVLLLAAVSIPISLMCGGFHQLTLSAWNEFFAQLPGMSFFDHLNVNESIKPLGATAPFGLLFLVVAVAPAIGEEVVFRGIIGRGLVARHGVLAGVVMTSLLFAAVHMHPAHVVALLPLAFFLHLSYLATRSILAPMMLHLLNNSLAVVLLKATAAVPALEGASEPDMPIYVLLISAGIVVLVGWTFWNSRVEYRTDDGRVWNPGYPTVEMPPESVGATLSIKQCPSGLHRGAVGLAGAYSLVFVVSLILMLTGHISA